MFYLLGVAVMLVGLTLGFIARAIFSAFELAGEAIFQGVEELDDLLGADPAVRQIEVS